MIIFEVVAYIGTIFLGFLTICAIFALVFWGTVLTKLWKGKF